MILTSEQINALDSVYEKIKPNPIPFPPTGLRSENEQPARHSVRIGPIEKVVGGTILRTPIDKTAAIVTSKAPWWAKPPTKWEIMTTSNGSPETKTKTEVRKLHDKELGEFYRIAAEEMLPDAVTESAKLFLRSIIETEAVMSLIDKDYADLTGLLSLKREECEKGIKDTMEFFHSEILRADTAFRVFNADSTQFIKDFRSTKQALVREVSELVGALQDLRTFFHGSVHMEEINRLKEFVELCERLKALKDSGFLDTVADTMLRLAVK